MTPLAGDSFDEFSFIDDVLGGKKSCTKCGVPQDPTEFYADARNRDGLQSHCKTCCRNRVVEYQAGVGRESHRQASLKYARSDTGAVKMKQYQLRRKQSDAAVMADRPKRRKYAASPKGQLAGSAAREKDKASGKYQARQAVYRAVLKGRLRDPGVCALADEGCLGRLEWHHYRGYAKEHWLTVVRLRTRHHRALDRLNTLTPYLLGAERSSPACICADFV